jgi:hypothetical protein
MLVVVERKINALQKRTVVHFSGNDRLAFASALHQFRESIDSEFALLLFLSVTPSAFCGQNGLNEFRVKLLVVVISTRVGERQGSKRSE